MEEIDNIFEQDDYCVGCGKLDCPGCRRELDPPRFCYRCGKKLTVKITPTDSVITCKIHGTINP